MASTPPKGRPSAARALLALGLCALSLVVSHEAHAKKKKPPRAPALPPIAYFLSGTSGLPGPTREVAVARCRAFQTRQRAKFPKLILSQDPRECETSLITVRGPYKRKKSKGGYDDAKVYVYKGSDGMWYDVNGEAPCFVAGTPIATPEGDKPIETMKAGDVVYAYDLEARQIVVSSVTRTKRRFAETVGTLSFGRGTSVTVTANHPFYSVATGSWLEAGRIAAGDEVLERRGDQVTPLRLVAKTGFDRDADVFEISVAKHHNYFAGGVLVHNY